jgi:hypothetical protein
MSNMESNASQIFPTTAPTQWTPASSTAYAGAGLMGPTPPNMAGGRRRRSRRSRTSRRSRKQSRRSRRSRR